MAPLLQKVYALLIVLAIGVSMAAGANAGVMSGDMAATAGMADMTSACDDGDCPDHDMTAAACYAACGGTLAVLSTAMGAPLRAGHDHYGSATPTQIGQPTTPDPSPPRSPS